MVNACDLNLILAQLPLENLNDSIEGAVRRETEELICEVNSELSSSFNDWNHR